MYKKVVRGEFEIPKSLSEEIKVLIKGLLTVDPKKRFSIEEAKMCSWYLKFKNEEASKGVIVGMHEIPVYLFYLFVSGKNIMGFRLMGLFWMCWKTSMWIKRMSNFI